MGELPFAGEGRRAVVDRLLEAFDGVSREGSPRLVTLEASVGWGKSRIVHEFYRRLAAERQTEPGYWPASVLDGVPGVSTEGMLPQERRKRTYPDVSTPAKGRVLEWFWWGIAATAGRSGSAIHALAVDLAQIGAHAEALEARWRQVSGRDEHLSQVLQRGEPGSIGDDGPRYAMLTGLEKVHRASVPGLGLLWWAKQAIRGQSERWSQVLGSGSQVAPLADQRTDLVEGLAFSLTHFAAAGIPIVIVVEDAHESDDLLVDLLVRTVNERRGPVLIVLTAWPGFLHDHDRAVHRLVVDIPQPARTRLLPEDLGDLSETDRARLVAALLPTADPAACEMLAARYHNPYALELVCGIGRVRELSKVGDLTPDELSRFPADVEGLYQVMWRSLDERVREALLLCVLATPSSLGDLFDHQAWDVDHVARSWGSLHWVSDRAVCLPVKLEEEARAWVTSIGGGLQRCHDSVQYRILSSAAREQLSDSQRTEYNQALASHIDPADPHLSPARRRVQAQVLATLAVGGVVAWTDPAIEAADALMLEAAQARDGDSLRTVIALSNAVPDRHAPADLRRRHHHATARAWSGQQLEAIEQFERLVADQKRILGDDFSETLEARRHLAYWLARSGQVAVAVEEFERLVSDRQRIFGTDHPATLAARTDLAVWLGKADQGDPDGAIWELDRLIADRQRIFGTDDVDTLAVRESLVGCLEYMDYSVEFIEQYELLVRDRQRIFGHDHLTTLAARRDLAWAVFDDFQYSEAIELYDQLLADRQRIFGPDDADTLVVRLELADILEMDKRWSEAGEHYQEVLAAYRRTFGDDHPTTLQARDRLIYFLERLREAAGDKQLRAEWQRILGADHADSPEGRTGFAKLRAGRVSEAVEVFEQLIANQQHTRGSDHPD